MTRWVQQFHSLPYVKVDGDMICILLFITRIELVFQASTEDARKAREARLKRFQQQKSSYATIMQEAATGWAPGDDRAETGNTSGSGDAGGAETSKGGLRHRGATKPS